MEMKSTPGVMSYLNRASCCILSQDTARNAVQIFTRVLFCKTTFLLTGWVCKTDATLSSQNPIQMTIHQCIF